MSSDGLAVVQAHLEAIRDLHEEVPFKPGYSAGCSRCHHEWPCASRRRAELALDALVVERERATTRDEQIRAYLDAIVEPHLPQNVPWNSVQECACGEDLPCPHRAEAEAIIDLLGAGDRA